MSRSLHLVLGSLLTIALAQSAASAAESAASQPSSIFDFGHTTPPVTRPIDFKVMAGQTPEQIFKAKGLIKFGAYYVVDTDAQLAGALRAIRAAQTKIEENTRKRAALDKEIQARINEGSRIFEERHAVAVKLTGTKDKVQAANLAARLIVLDDQLSVLKSQIVSREAAIRKLGDPGDDYVGLVLDLADKVEAAIKRYQALAADAQVEAATATVNQKSPSFMKLGPTSNFTAELPYVRKLRQAISTAVIKLQMQGGVPAVEVSLNSKVKTTMVVDSGASSVVLSADVADELGLKPGPKDPIVQLTIADGKTVDAARMTLPSVRLGQFVVENVPCVVLPKSAKGAQCLLGGTFLRNFIYRMNLGAGELHMSQIRGKTNPAGETPVASIDPKTTTTPPTTNTPTTSTPTTSTPTTSTSTTSTPITKPPVTKPPVIIRPTRPEAAYFKMREAEAGGAVTAPDEREKTVMAYLRDLQARRWYAQLIAIARDELRAWNASDQSRADLEKVLTGALVARAEACLALGNHTMASQAVEAAENAADVEVDANSLKRIRAGLDRMFAGGAPQSLLSKEPLSGDITWAAKPNGYSLGGGLRVGNSKSNHGGTDYSAKVKAEPGFVLDGGLLNSSRGSIFFDGQPDKPIILRNVRIGGELWGYIKARHTIFINCQFSKTGNWYGSYSSKWDFQDCLLLNSNFHGLGRTDYGIKFNRCIFVQCKLPRRIGQAGKPEEDGAKLWRHEWSHIDECDFYDCDIALTDFWMMQGCNAYRCRATGEGVFASKTHLTVALGLPSEDSVLLDTLEKSTTCGGSGKLVYSQGQTLFPRAQHSTLWQWVDKLGPTKTSTK